MCSTNFRLKLQNTVKHSNHIMGTQEYTTLEYSFDLGLLIVNCSNIYHQSRSLNHSLNVNDYIIISYIK